MGASILFLKTSEPGSALLTLLERSIGPWKCPRIQWIYISIKLEIAGQREPALSAVGLWGKSLPFLLSFPGIHFVFLDFVVFAQLGSSTIVHTSIREVVSCEEALAMFSVFGHYENLLRSGFSFRNK